MNKFDVGPIIRNLDGMNKNFEKYQTAVLRDLQLSLIKNIRKKAPRKTGKYADSWKAGAINGDTAIIETPFGMLYAILEWSGARASLRKGKLMVWEDETTGETVFAMKVNHPGIDKVPHVRPALKQTMAEAKPIMYAHLDILSSIYNEIARANKAKAEALTK